ncbi:hypothetical protein CS343_15255 [Bordetella bronchiseptica]|nr:hypothetical protein CS343_15255 [Bordetella bronchiseptica]
MREARCEGDLDSVLSSPVGIALHIALTNTALALADVRRATPPPKTKFDARRAAAGDFDTDLDQ